jgi:hypothetical protein
MVITAIEHNKKWIKENPEKWEAMLNEFLEIFDEKQR